MAQTFDLRRVLGRARDLLPEGGVARLDGGQRKLILRGAWATSEVDGPATKEEIVSLEGLAELLALPKASPDWGPGKVGQAAFTAALRDQSGDVTFRRWLWAALYTAAMGDGFVQEPERRFLTECGEAVGIDAASRADLERDLHVVFYEEIVATVLKNNEISPGERKILNATRKLLGLDEAEAARIEIALREGRSG
jgi:hypothetical protein